MNTWRLLEKITFLPVEVLTFGFIYMVERKTHHEMVLDNCPVVARASYRQFKAAFIREKWLYDNLHVDSLFDPLMENGAVRYKEANIFHAGIIRMNGVGYLLTSLGLILARRLRNKKIKALREIELPKYITLTA